MLPRSQVEAAARLLVLQEEVDVQVFDALAICLAGRDFDDAVSEAASFWGVGSSSFSRQSSRRSHSRRSILTAFGGNSNRQKRPTTPVDSSVLEEARAFSSRANGEMGKGPGRTSIESLENSVNQQYSALCAWMIELTRRLLEPSNSVLSGLEGDVVAASSSAAVQTGDRTIADVNASQQISDDSKSLDFPGDGLIRRPTWEKFIYMAVRHGSGNEKKFERTTTTEAILKREENQEADNRRFRYLAGTVCRARIWRHHDGALFEELKRDVQSLVKKAAVACDLRYEQLQKEGGGEALLGSWWFTSRQISTQKISRVSFANVAFFTASSADFFRQNDEQRRDTASLSSRTGRREKNVELLITSDLDGGTANVQKPVQQAVPTRIHRCRQDDPMVQAIRVSDIDLLEAGVPNTQRTGRVEQPFERLPSEQPFERLPSNVCSIHLEEEPKNELELEFPSTGPQVGSIRPKHMDPKNGSTDWAQEEFSIQSPPSHLISGIRTDEEIFLQQLYRRARILSRPFQKRVFQEICRHAAKENLTFDVGSLIEPANLRSPTNDATSSTIPSQGANAHGAACEANSSFSAARALRRKTRGARIVDCLFNTPRHSDSSGPELASSSYISPVEVKFAPVKTLARMREKVKEYDFPEANWPLSANILDPVRISLICEGPLEIVEVVRWFFEAEEESNLRSAFSLGIVGADIGDEDVRDEDDPESVGVATDNTDAVPEQQHAPSPLSVMFIKNRFTRPREQVPDGYRDVKLFARFTDSVSGLSIIGEIQIHDRQLHEIKLQMHKLYKVVRAHSADLVE